MGSGCDQVSVLEGRGDSSSCHQAADVSHVCQQVGVELNAQLQDTKSGWFMKVSHLLTYIREDRVPSMPFSCARSQ